MRVVGTVPADEAETVSRVEQAAQAAQEASAAVQQALADAARKPPLWRRILTPLALGVVGAVLLLLTFREYPRPPAPLANPGPAKLTITTAATVTGVSYEVGANKVSVSVFATLPHGPRASASEAVVEVDPREAHNQPFLAGWVKTLRFAPFPGGEFEADANFSMGPYDGGMAYNGLTASAAFPEVVLSAPRANPVLEAGYDIPSGSSYDWSPSAPLPPIGSADPAKRWDIQLTSADTAGQIVVGTNHAAEDATNFRIFIAGVLAALAGTAFVAAFQEALARFAR